MVSGPHLGNTSQRSECHGTHGRQAIKTIAKGTIARPARIYRAEGVGRRRWRSCSARRTRQFGGPCSRNRQQHMCTTCIRRGIRW